MNNKHKVNLYILQIVSIFIFFAFLPIVCDSQVSNVKMTKRNEEDCFKYFHYGNECDTWELTCELYYAIKELNYDGIKCLVDKFGNLNVKSEKLNAYNVPVIHASLISDKKMLEILLNGKNVDLEIKDDQYGMTALMWVNFLIEIPEARGNYFETTKLLIKHGANVNTQNKEGITPLMLNSKANRLKFVKVFLKNGANPNIQSKAGMTALMMSADNPQIIKTLLLAGSNVFLKDENGRTSVFYAMEKCQPNKLKVLSNNKDVFRLADNSGLTPFQFAQQNNLLEKCPIISEIFRNF